MKLFDDIIIQQLNLLVGNEPKVLEYVNGWKDDGNNGIILRSDMAYELGGGDLFAVTDTVMTEDSELINENKLLLYGPDLNEIKSDASYARMVILKVKENAFSDDNIYNEISKVAYTKYHVHPHGFMQRISSVNRREPVRIGRAALGEGLDFSKVASMYLDAYLKNPQVEYAKIIFITLDDFEYTALDKLSEKTNQIVVALDEVSKKLLMDCNACNLKPVCDEVEGLKELHFSTSHGL